ncbi:MAG: stage V sporulation protein AE [Candidatus Improbicoccus pseudotrichonymphae]|uniref:Stage V sporulation protein AE n=1 Tax=Candidatus Improbicoccus pseudotrichonymphae TaxID=3033792 RepID=A0AA48I4F3_9FIRM|nr:MAG: stage V sporulation protein AE [Candidatus Improbicoccus pseudotrichonymphae]
MEYLNAFWVGGLICLIAQILIDRTKMTPARILVLFVTSGVILTAIGVYEPVVKFAGAGATVPLVGFGYTMAKGVIEMIAQKGFSGVFSGGLNASAAGISAAVFFGYIASLLVNPGEKS